jgi:hypothetical protein
MSSFPIDLVEKMVLAVERVRQRLIRAVQALESAGIPYAVAGGHAVAAWVATVDAGATRNTPDVDILLRRGDLEKAARVLESAGFIRHPGAGNDMFLDGPDGKARDAVHLAMAGEKVRAEDTLPAPDVTESAKPDQFRVLTLESLVRMKLTAFRLMDRVHLRDLLEVGLIDATWAARMPPELGSRLQHLIDTPGQ